MFMIMKRKTYDDEEEVEERSLEVEVESPCASRRVAGAGCEFLNKVVDLQIFLEILSVCKYS